MFRRWSRRLSETDEERLAAQVRDWAQTVPDAVRIDEAPVRQRVKVAGVVNRLSVVPGQGDVSSDAISVVAGRVQVNAPISPGLRQVTFSYEIPTKRDPIEVLVEQPATVLEVLVEEPQAVVTGAGLVNVDAVTIDGRPFRRFLAQDVAAAQVISISIPPSASASSLRMMMIVTAVGAAMLLGLGMYTMRRGPAMARRREDDPEALALEIAALDAAYERLGSPNAEQKGEHYVKRAQLKGRLNNALAKREGLA